MEQYYNESFTVTHSPPQGKLTARALPTIKASSRSTVRTQVQTQMQTVTSTPLTRSPFKESAYKNGAFLSQKSMER